MLPTFVGQALRIGAWLATIALIVACSDGTGSDPAPQSSAAEFVGSDACRDCHVPEYEAWRQSHHDLAMASADPSTVRGDFRDATFEYFGSRSHFRRDGDSYVVKTANADGVLQEFRVTHTFGVEPLQQYLVATGGGRLQALPFAWDTRDAALGGQRWLHLYPDHNISPGDPLHWTGRLQNWNFMCAECHSTDVGMNYDAATDTFATTFSEVSVGCEACHGPGSKHIAAAHGDSTGNRRRGFVVDLDDQRRATWMMNAETGIAERSELLMQAPKQPEACGRCHARRSVIAPSYEYGRPLTDTHMPSLLDEGLYFADGQIQDEVYVYGSFLQSRMYRAGVTCSNCHDPHSLRLATGANPNHVCAQCHLTSKFESAEHTGHAAGSAGCVDCHMPTRTYMSVDDRRDHSFRVPRPDLSVAVGTPNACAACHADRSPAWASAAIEEQHGRERRPEFATAIAAARRGPANAGLLQAFRQSEHSGIARASALSLLAPPFGEAELAAVRDGLYNPDPLIRIAALRVHRQMPPDIRLEFGSELLGDTIRAVRIEAALAYAPLAAALPAALRRSLDAAAAEYRAAYSAQLNRPESYVSLGNLDAAEGDVDAAIKRFEAALDLDPDSNVARVNLADALRLSGDDARGRAVLEEGIRRTPDVAILHHALGLLDVRMGNRAKALDALREAARLEPDNARFAYVLGVAESEIGRTGND